jgi:septal ring factor EnvC (AmiA/AmiB activator)
MTSLMRTTRRGASPAVIAVATAALLMAGTPAAFASEPAPPDVEATSPDIGLAEAQELVSELRSQVDELSAANTELSGENEALSLENDQLQQQVDTLTTELDRLADGLTRFESLYRPLEADRQLLLALRKPIEDLTRPDAEKHIERVRALAESSNPSVLGRISDRVGEAAPAFLDWRDEEFTSTEEASRAFIESGAGAFTTTMQEFQNEILLSVATRLDSLLSILDRAR